MSIVLVNRTLILALHAQPAMHLARKVLPVLLLPRFVVVEVELVDGNFLEELRVLPAELNGALPSVLQFNVG